MSHFPKASEDLQSSSISLYPESSDPIPHTITPVHSAYGFLLRVVMLRGQDERDQVGEYDEPGTTAP